jgi:hypothetical protein
MGTAVAAANLMPCIMAPGSSPGPTNCSCLLEEIRR